MVYSLYEEYLKIWASLPSAVRTNGVIESATINNPGEYTDIGDDNYVMSISQSKTDSPDEVRQDANMENNLLLTRRMVLSQLLKR